MHTRVSESRVGNGGNVLQAVDLVVQLLKHGTAACGASLLLHGQRRRLDGRQVFC